MTEARSSDSFTRRYGPWAVVTGAAQGIGAAFTEQLMARGVSVLAVDRGEELLAEQAARLEASGVACRVVVADLGSASGLDQVCAAMADLEIGLVVANAATNFVGSVADQGLAAGLAQLDVNCRAPLTLLHAVLPDFLERNRGGFVTVSSLSAMRGTAFTAGYAASKAWNLVFAESLADELRDTGVDILAVLPGTTRTPGWLSSDPHDSPATSGAMEPADVVSEALDALGRQAIVIPGQANRDAEGFLLSLPRDQAVSLTGDVMRQTYPDAASGVLGSS